MKFILIVYLWYGYGLVPAYMGEYKNKIACESVAESMSIKSQGGAPGFQPRKTLCVETGK